MSPVLLNAYAAMLPRLEAEEALLQRKVIASASGTLRPATDRPFVASLQRAAGVHSGVKVRTLADLQKTGIPIVKVVKET